MKRIWWNSREECVMWYCGPGSVLRSDVGCAFTTDYRGEDWRDIASAEWNPETGAIHITVVEPVKHRKALAEIELPEKGSGIVHFYSFCSDGSYGRVCDSVGGRVFDSFYSVSESGGVIPPENISVSGRAKPKPKYTDEAVDELLDALKIVTPSVFDSRCPFSFEKNIREWDAVQALLKQREAADA